ncbi:MAG: 16S rRNA (guanine(527)-N(7))-methyltransferase RsmG [Candidatus Dormibacteria bacterium]
MSAPPAPEERRLLERYLDELSLWTRRVNLTTVPRHQAWNRHVEESLELLAAGRWAAGASLVDIGSGGGVPGVVIAVMRPDLSITLVESDRRKAGFLTHVCGLLGLPHVRVLPRRAEDMGRDPAHAGAYDLAVSRACAPPSELIKLAMPLLRGGGSLWAMVRDAESAVRALSGAPGAEVSVAAPGLLLATRP